MKRWILLLALLFFIGMPFTVLAASYGPNNELCWSPPITPPTFDGYKIYWGALTKTYTSSKDIDFTAASDTKCVTPTIGVKLGSLGLASGTYFMAVTAYNAAGESLYSNEVSVPFVSAVPNGISDFSVK